MLGSTDARAARLPRHHGGPAARRGAGARTMLLKALRAIGSALACFACCFVKKSAAAAATAVAS